MKTRNVYLVAAAVLLTCSTTSNGDDSKKTKTVWVPAPTGSLLGGGYYKQVNSDDPPKNAAEGLADAVATLNARSRITPGHVLPAVANQTGVPIKTLRAQQAATRMFYGDLLVANLVANSAGKSVNEVIMLRAKNKDWMPVANQLHVTVSSLSTAARKAEEAADLAAAGGARSRRQTGEQQMEDLGVRPAIRPGG